MAVSDKAAFMKAVTILADSREQQNAHILKALEGMKVKVESRKLDIGDYSFMLPGRDFSLSCAIERKANPEEIYSNIMERMPGHTNRLEKELLAGSRCLTQMTLLIEGVESMDALRGYVIPDWKMKMTPQRVNAEIGQTCYSALRAWQLGNRYNFRIECVGNKANTAAKMLEEFYYFYHNFKDSIAPRKK